MGATGDPVRLSRRTVLGGAALGGAALGGAALGGAAGMIGVLSSPDAAHGTATRPSMMDVPFDRRDRVRIGIIGAGDRGTGMLRLLLRIAGVQITAVSDLDADRVARAADLVRQGGQPQPATYAGGEQRFERLCARDDIDLVYVATPWEWHHPMAKSAMRHGKHVGVETPLAMTLEHLWDLVATSEETRRHCIQLENCCYGRTEMRLLRMAHEGLFGDLLHAAGAYLHDLRAYLFNPRVRPEGWRRAWHTRLPGDLYPTHGFGPVATYLDLNRGDRPVRLVAMGSPSLGLAAYRDQRPAGNAAGRREKYITADLCTSLIQTARGRVVRLEHGVSTPRPYSRVNSLTGTKGVFEDYPPRVYLEPDMKNHTWGSFDAYAGHDHWLWKDFAAQGTGSHGGADSMMLWRLVQMMRLGLVPDIDVYDSATWSAPIALSARSMAAGGAPVDFPDFTRGRWRAARPGMDSVRPTATGAVDTPRPTG